MDTVHKVWHIQYIVLLDGTSPNNKIIHWMLRDQKAHVAEDPGAVAMVPRQVDGPQWDELVAGDSCPAVFLQFC